MAGEGFRMAGFLYIIFSVARRHRKDGRKVIFQDIISQIYFTGVQSMGLVFVVALLLGGLLIIQSATYITSVGEEFFGTMVNVIIIRELGSLLTAIIVLLRSGSAVATEMGYMAVLKETKGIEMMGINPIHYLALPRVIGISISMVCLFICFIIISILGGMVLTWMITNIEMTNLIKELSQSIGAIDLFVGVFRFGGLPVSRIQCSGCADLYSTPGLEGHGGGAYPMHFFQCGDFRTILSLTEACPETKGKNSDKLKQCQPSGSQWKHRHPFRYINGSERG